MQRKEIQSLKAGAPAKPSNLSGAAAKEWDRLIDEMAKSGIPLSPGYRGMLEIAATLYAHIQEADAAIAKDGRYLTNARSGALVLHPAVGDATACRNRLVFVLVELGLAPKATPAEPEPVDDELDIALRRKG